MCSQKTKRLNRIFYFLRLTDPIRFCRLIKTITGANSYERRTESNPATMPADDQPPINASQLARLKALDIVSFNAVAEELFVLLITDYIQTDGPQPAAAIYAEAAFELDISIETAKRYLLKHTARRAEFVIQDKMVSLKKEVTK